MGLDLGEHSGLASMHPDGAASAGSGAAPSEPSTPLENIDSVVHDYVASMDNGARPELCDGVSPHAESFRRLLDSSATSTGQILGPPVLFGASPPMAIESILGLLGNLRETGVLHVEADGVTFTISIVKGDVVHGVSRPRPPSELLGNILVSMGTIDAAQLSRFLEEHGSSASTIGQALDNEWLVSTEELGRALEQQLRMLFSRLLATRQTVWCFRAGEATLAYINMRLNVISILLESARTNDEQSTA